MEESELLRRAEDLCRRCERTGSVTGTAFLTPAEQAELLAWANFRPDCNLRLSGGQPDCERKAAFFLPPWEENFSGEEHFRALKAVAGFGEPGHRDYLGAALALGIRRDFLGDIRIFGSTAYLFCLPSVAPHLLSSLEKVGRCGVRLCEVPLSAVPAEEKRVRARTFTVQSLRLDVIVAGLFGLSRTTAADAIREGAAALNYLPCLKTDAPVREGDVISLRGHGKGILAEIGGESRKGRIFVRTELYL